MKNSRKSLTGHHPRWPRREGSPWADRAALRLVAAGDGAELLARLKIEHFNRVVAERGDEQPLSFHVDGEMVEPPFHVGQSNRFDKLECSRFGCARRHRDQAGEGKPESSPDCLIQLSGRLHGAPQFFVCNRVCLWLKSNWRERENNSTSAIPGGAALLDFAEAEFCGYCAFHEPSRLRVADPRHGPRLCDAPR